MSENNLNNRETNASSRGNGVCTCDGERNSRNQQNNRANSQNQERSENCHCHESCRCGEEDYTRTEMRERLLKQTETECDCSKISETDLQEVYKNACTGKESVEILKRFSSDKGFRNILIRQYKGYSSLAKEIELYANQLGYGLEKTSMFAKGMMYFTTAVNTLKDKSDAKLSEIMMQGINMGIIAMTKLINRLSEENRTCSFAESLLSLLNKNLEEMKLFL